MSGSHPNVDIFREKLTKLIHEFSAMYDPADKEFAANHMNEVLKTTRADTVKTGYFSRIVVETVPASNAGE